MTILLPIGIEPLKNDKINISSSSEYTSVEANCEIAKIKVHLIFDEVAKTKLEEGEYKITNFYCQARGRDGICSFKDNRGFPCGIKSRGTYRKPKK